jgi:hypothetical protein
VFLFIVVMGARSYFVADSLHLGRGAPGMYWQGSAWGRAYRIDSGVGCLAFVIDDTVPAGGRLGRGFRWSSGFVEPSWLMGDSQLFMGGKPVRQFHLLGFGWAVYQGSPPLSSLRSLGPVSSQPILARRFIVPYWALMLLSGVAAMPWVYSTFGSWRRARRMHLGQCLTCGYDLRASNNRCPECGTPFSCGDR